MYPPTVDAFTCAPCGSDDPRTILFTCGAVALLLVAVLFAVIWHAASHPHLIHVGVSTIAIFTNHIQTTTALSSLGLATPQLIKDISSVIGIQLPRAACLLRPGLNG